MLLRSTRKSWRNAVGTAKSEPDRNSKAYRAGRAIGQLARGEKPSEYREKNPLEGKKRVANIAAYANDKRYNFAYDEETGDLYGLHYEHMEAGTEKAPKWVAPKGGLRVSRVNNIKEYQPVDFGSPSDRPGTIPGRGTKGRRYTGLDAVVRSLRDEGADVFGLDMAPGKGKQASASGGMVNWRSKGQFVGDYVDPRRRHDIPTGTNPAKGSHNMFWRQIDAISEQERKANEVLQRGTARDVIDKVYSSSKWRGNPPGPGQNPPTSGPTGPTSGPPPRGAGPFPQAEGVLKQGDLFSQNRLTQPPPSSGQTPGPPPSRNELEKLKGVTEERPGVTEGVTEEPDYEIPLMRNMTGASFSRNLISRKRTIVPQEPMRHSFQKYADVLRDDRDTADRDISMPPGGQSWRQVGVNPQSPVNDPTNRPARGMQDQFEDDQVREFLDRQSRPEPEQSPQVETPTAPTEAPPEIAQETATRGARKNRVRTLPPMAPPSSAPSAESDRYRKQLDQLGRSHRGSPYKADADVIEEFARRDQAGLNPVPQFDDDMTDPTTGQPISRDQFHARARAVADTTMSGAGMVPKRLENPYEYRAKNGEGDDVIEAYTAFANALDEGRGQIANPRERRAVTDVINRRFVDPALTLQRQRGLQQAAEQAESEGNIELAKRLLYSADAEATDAYRRLDPQGLEDAYATFKGDPRGDVIGDVTGMGDNAKLMPSVFLSSPQMPVSSVNAQGTIQRQAEIDRMNLDFSRATGQGGKEGSEKNTKLFNTVAVPSPIPWTDDQRELMSGIPRTQFEDQNAEIQFDRDLAGGPQKSKFDAPFTPTRFEAQSGPMPLEDQIAESVAARLASVSRYGASLSFGANSMDAAGNRVMLQGQDGEEGFAPQAAFERWQSYGDVEKQAGAIEKSMSQLQADTYADTFAEYQAKARDFVETLPPDMTPEQTNAAAEAFIRQEFNTRLRSDYERIKNPEADTSGSRNVFRTPHKRIQEVFDAEIPGIVNPEGGDPFDAWDARTRSQEDPATRNVVGGLGMIDQGIYERTRDFWSGDPSQMSPDAEFASIGIRADRRSQPPPPAPPTTEGVEGVDYTAGDTGAATMRRGLRRVGKIEPQTVSRKQRKSFLNDEELAVLRGQLEPLDQKTGQQLARQNAELRTPNELNQNRLDPSQLDLGDVVSFGGKGNRFEEAEVTEIFPDGSARLEDGPRFGDIIAKPDELLYYRDILKAGEAPPVSSPPKRTMSDFAAWRAQRNPAPPIAPSPIAPQQPAASPVAPKARKGGNKTPGLMPEAFERLQGTVFQQIIQGEVPKIMSRSEAQKKFGRKDVAGYDAMEEGLGSKWNNKVFARKGGSTPDEVHAHLVEKGLMHSDSTVDDMVVELQKGFGQYEREVGRLKGEKVQKQQAVRQEKEVFVQKKSKGKPINPEMARGEDLVVGQKLEIAVPGGKKTEMAEVVDIDEDGTAILEDGERYGPIPVPPKKWIYYKKLYQSAFADDDSPF